MPRVRSVSFAAAGFNAVYYVGVLHYLQTHRERLSPRCLFLGSSSGSVMGPLLVCGVGLRRIMERVVPFLEESHRLKNFWASARRFIRTVFSLLPHDAHRRCSRRCAKAASSATSRAPSSSASSTRSTTRSRDRSTLAAATRSSRKRSAKAM